jgi:hypothetical protein
LGGLGLRNFLDLFDHYLELSSLVTASHVRIEMLQCIFSLDRFDFLLEREPVSVLAQLAGYLVEFDFAQCRGPVLEYSRSRMGGT